MLYDLDNHQTYEVSFENSECSCPFESFSFGEAVDTDDNMWIGMIAAGTLKDFFEKEKLTGKLKQIAEKVHEEDNQVVMIAKFK